MRPTRLLGLAAVVGALAPHGADAGAKARWFSAWSRPQSVVVGAAADAADGGRGPSPLVDQTVRDVVRVTGAGSAVRIRLSNRYGASLVPTGTLPLHVTAATLSRRTSGASVTALRQVT